MKQETNNEMDLLLRRLGRRDDAVVSGAADDHLDADELNAYAENALPAAARARYTVHLAECAGCRSLVVQLSSSAGVVATTGTAAVSEPSGFRKFLASLFTPMVLRYAAPALGLIVVAVIGFVVLRRDQAAKYVAQDTNTQQRPDVAPAAEPQKGLVDSPSNTIASPEKAGEKEKNQPAQPAPAPNTAPAVSSVEADAKDKALAQPKPEEQAGSANAAPPPKPEPTPAEQSRRAADPEVNKSEVKELPANSPPADKAYRGARREDSETDNFARARKPAAVASAPATGSVSNMQADGLVANTRTVAGRRFRKQGSVCIDTAYDSSKDAMSLRRGSEQYRALVADEPAIKTIADTLEGEIIVVWKTRTYRIR